MPANVEEERVFFRSEGHFMGGSISQAIKSLPNVLEELVPESGKYSNVLKVCYLPEENLRLMADVVSREVLCFR